MNNKAKSDISHKLKVFQHSQEYGNVSKTCRYFGISRETSYCWKRAYEERGEHALINSKPCPENPKLRIPTKLKRKLSL